MTEEDLFAAALAIPAGQERTEYLRQACVADDILRERVERLLARHEDNVSFLGQLPTGVVRLPHPELTAEKANGDPPTVAYRDPADAATLTQSEQPGTKPKLAQREEGEVPASPVRVIGGRYTLESLLGQGGMGEVWEARQTEPVKRQVAVKLIKNGMDSKSVLARFDQERQALALMDHPNIARIYDGGVTAIGQPFFVMELVKGMALTEYCDAERLTVPARLQLFVQVCHAVQHAHQKGIIHRDLKPGNVLVTEVDGRPTPKVIDFGVAKATEMRLTDQSFADTGIVVGTPAYMSPEQADPTTIDVDTRTDVYALGIMLYELLTGSPPIDSKQFKRGALLEMLRMVREVEPQRPSTRLSTADGLPSIAANRNIEPARLAKLLRGELDWVVMKALEKDRDRRYDTANGFAADIQRYLSDEVVEARPPSRGYRLRKFVKRNKLQVIATTLVFFALMAGVIGTTLGMIEADKQSEKATAEANRANDEANRANNEAKAARKAEAEAKQRETAETEAKALAQVETKRANDNLQKTEFLLYVAMLERTQAAFQNNDSIRARFFLEQCQPNQRGWEHRHLRNRLSSLITLNGHADYVFSVAFSPDGKRMLTGSGDNTAKVWDAEKGTEILVLKGHTSAVSSVVFSPDGKRILTGSWDSTARVWDAEKGTEVLALKGHTDRIMGATFSPDGKRILTGSWDSTARVWDAEKGTEVLALKGHIRRLISVAFSPDGRRILTGGDDFTARVWDAEKGTELLTLKGHTREVQSVAFSPDGKRIITGSWDNTAKVWDARTGLEVLSLKGHLYHVMSVVFSPDGKRILTGSWEGTARVWDAEKGTEILALVGHTNSLSAVAFSPDGRRILTGGRDKTAKLWDAERGTQGFALSGHTTIVRSVAFSPDGKRMLTGSFDRTARVWDVERGTEVFALKGHTSEVSSVAFSSDGKRILTGSWDKTAKVWDAETGKEVVTLEGHKYPVTCVTFSPDGKRILTGGGDPIYRDRPGEAKVWDTDKGTEAVTLKGHTETVYSVAFSPDGKRMVTGSLDFTAKVWNAETGNEVLTLKGHMLGVSSVAFSPDGKRILTGSYDNTAKVWNAETGTMIVSLNGHLRAVNSVAFSPDGKRIITASDDATVKLWDAEKGPEVFSLKGHTAPIVSVAFSPNGECILTGSEDTTARVWNTVKGNDVLGLKGHTDNVSSVAFSPDGKTLFGWDGTGAILAWNTITGQSVAPVNPPPRPAPGPVKSHDGRFSAKPQGRIVTLADMFQPAGSPWPLPTAAERKEYHSQQADISEKDKKWFAVAFHVGRMLLDDPYNADLKNRRDEALKKHSRNEIALPISEKK